MKKIFVLALCIGILSIGIDIKSASAQAKNPCAADPGKVKFEGDEDYGFDITRAEETFPNGDGEGEIQLDDALAESLTGEGR
jgi:hypothetical protein